MDIMKLKAFIPQLFSQMFVELLVYGNITKTVSTVSKTLLAGSNSVTTLSSLISL